MNVTYDNLTETVIATLSPDTDPRTREIMTSAITHLHGFVRDTRLSLGEFLAACRLLVRAGQCSDASRDEFVLMANVLGLEVLIDMIANAGDPQTCILGPMYRDDAPHYANGESIVLDMPDNGETVLLSGTVTDENGKPITDAAVDVWEPSTNGLYENQDPAQPEMNLRGRFLTDTTGRYAVRCIRPTSYPIPHDGPGGDLLRALGRHAMRPAHIHFMVSAPGYGTIISQVYDAGSDYLEDDAIVAVKDSLIATFEPAPAGGDTDFVVTRDWKLRASTAAA